jgi:hypothetical protein
MINEEQFECLCEHIGELCIHAGETNNLLLRIAVSMEKRNRADGVE